MGCGSPSIADLSSLSRSLGSGEPARWSRQSRRDRRLAALRRASACRRTWALGTRGLARLVSSRSPPIRRPRLRRVAAAVVDAESLRVCGFSRTLARARKQLDYWAIGPNINTSNVCIPGVRPSQIEGPGRPPCLPAFRAGAARSQSYLPLCRHDRRADQLPMFLDITVAI